jgi:hypothetical protein
MARKRMGDTLLSANWPRCPPKHAQNSHSLLQRKERRWKAYSTHATCTTTLLARADIFTQIDNTCTNTSTSHLPQRIPRPLRIKQLHHPPVHKTQTPLTRLKDPIPPLPLGFKPCLPLRLRPLHPEPDIDPPVQLIQLAPDPWHLAREVYLIA